jgi:hypothetical protein
MPLDFSLALEVGVFLAAKPLVEIKSSKLFAPFPFAALGSIHGFCYN